MRVSLQDPPRWLTFLVAGVPFGLLMGLTAKSDGDSWLGAGFMVTSGIPFGLGMVWWSARWRREQQEKAAEVPADLERAARRALSSGDVPDDAGLRSAAITVASRDLAEAGRHRWHRVTSVCVMVIVASLAAASGSWWAVLLFGAGGAMSFYLYAIVPRRLLRRVKQFRAAP
jgi:drug/metabolite transporter (DMT)-like permease